MYFFAIPDQDKLILFQKYFESKAPLRTIKTVGAPSSVPPKTTEKKNYHQNNRKGKRLYKETQTDDKF